MDDEVLDPKDKDLEDDFGDEEFDDESIIGKKKGKKAPSDDDHFDADALADEEDEALPEDSYDDQDLW